MTNKPIPLLSKTRYVGGLQCLKRVYLESYFLKLAAPIDAAKQALFDQGATIGELARRLYPSGALVPEAAYEHNSAVDSTSRFLADETIPSIYEAAFTFDGIRTRVDILQRLSAGEFALAEVKSSTRVKEEHIPDVAVQVYIAEGVGLSINKSYLVHIDNSYVYSGGEYELNKLFQIEDITSAVRSYIATQLTENLEKIKATLAEEEVPTVNVGRHCSQPYECPFYSHCREGLPTHHVEQLPGVRVPILQSLLAAGIDDIRNIPDRFDGLSDVQRRVRDSVVNEKPYIGLKLGELASQVQYPLRFLDFETFNPALPQYSGTRPYQVIPFQWSMHIQDLDGNLDHSAFLFAGPNDPRPRFIESLLENAGSEGTIVVYSSYESTRLKQLAAEFPDYEDSLIGLCERMFDLLKPIRSFYYHPDFHGSYSLKTVLPVLVPQMGYGDLEVTDGSDASLAYATMIAPATSEAERERINRALLAYCARDTEAMVRIYEALSSMTDSEARINGR